jgi:hypothetical protein
MLPQVPSQGRAHETVFVAFCIFSLLLPWREITAAELPQKLSSAVRAAEADGLSLFKASGQPRTIDY